MLTIAYWFQIMMKLVTKQQLLLRQCNAGLQDCRDLVTQAFHHFLAVVVGPLFILCSLVSNGSLYCYVDFLIVILCFRIRFFYPMINPPYLMSSI